MYGTEPRYNEQISPVPWHFVKSRFHCNYSSSDALPLSDRRLVGAKAIKLDSWDKHLSHLFQYYSFFVERDTYEKRVEALTSLVASLSEENRKLIKTVMRHLTR